MNSLESIFHCAVDKKRNTLCSHVSFSVSYLSHVVDLVLDWDMCVYLYPCLPYINYAMYAIRMTYCKTKGIYMRSKVVVYSLFNLFVTEL